MKLSDALTLGSHVIYAAGNKDDDKQTITAVVDFADVVYQDAVLPQNGPGSLQPLGSSDLFDVTNADSTAASGQGAMGIAPYVKFQVMDDLMLAAHVAYLAKAEDAADPTIEIDSAFYYGIGASWALAPSAKLDFGYTAAIPERRQRLRRGSRDLQRLRCNLVSILLVEPAASAA
jgi:hypothetical protein